MWSYIFLRENIKFECYVVKIVCAKSRGLYGSRGSFSWVNLLGQT